MEVTSEEIRQRLEGLSDEELLAMVKDDPSQYIPGALSLAEDEVSRRGLTGEETLAADPPTATVAFVESAKVGARAVAEAMRPGIYLANERKIVCTHCKNDRFTEQAVLLNTRGLTFFKLDWLNRNATTLICSTCGLIQWFAMSPRREFSQSQEK